MKIVKISNVTIQHNYVPRLIYVKIRLHQNNTIQMVEISNLKINKNFVYINLQNLKHTMTQMCL